VREAWKRAQRGNAVRCVKPAGSKRGEALGVCAESRGGMCTVILPQVAGSGAAAVRGRRWRRPLVGVVCARRVWCSGERGVAVKAVTTKRR